MTRSFRFLTLSLLVAVTLTACSSNNGSKQSNAPKGTPVSFDGKQESSIPLVRVANAGSDGGRLTKDPALQVFAWQYGPVPGVQTPAGNPGVRASGSLALYSVLRYWNELSDAQRAAIRPLAGLPDDYAPTAGQFGKSRPARRAAPTPVKAFEAELARVRGEIEPRLGTLSFPIFVTKESVNLSTEADALADALVRGGVFGTGCYIRMFPGSDASKSTLFSVLGHEVMHCYQFEWGPILEGWITEGQAEWVGAVVGKALTGGSDPNAAGWVESYYETPGTALFKRTYDAVGWWMHLNQSGVNVWSRLKSVVEAGGGDASFAVATAGADETLLREWGSRGTGLRQLGGSWFLSGPGAPDATGPGVGFNTVSNTTGVTRTIVPYSAAYGGVDFTADLVEFSYTGNVQGLLRKNGQRTLVGLDNKKWCTKGANDCVCPPNTKSAGERFDTLPGGKHEIAFTGGPESVTVTITGKSLKDACDGVCMVGTWRLNGPPTGSGLSFKSGGTGAILKVGEDGVTTYDFTPSEPVVLDTGGGEFSIKYSGVGKALALLPTDPNGGSASFTGIDTTGITAEDITIDGKSSLDGLPTSLIADAVTKEFRKSIFIEDASFTASCPGNQLVISNSVVTLNYTKVGK
ncbi:MAG: hypothetical protein ACOYNI_02205 [Acidimicrobiia bacterium]